MQRGSQGSPTRGLRYVATVILTLGVLGSCGPDAVDPGTLVAKLQLRPSEVTIEGWGVRYVFEVQAYGADGNLVFGLPVSWNSSDTTVARMEDETVVTIRDGTTTITASIGDCSASATLIVAQRPNWVTITVPSRSMVIGDTMRAVVEVRDAGGTVMPSAPVHWQSSYPDRLTVDSTGLIRALRGGQGQIRAGSGGRTAWVDIAVADTAFRARVTLAGSPWHIEQASTGVVYVTQPNSGQLSRISIWPADIANTFDVGAEPTRISFTPDGRVAFVTLASAIALIDVEHDSVIARYPAGARPLGIAAMPDSTAYFLTEWGDGFTTCFFRLFPDSTTPVQPIGLNGIWGGIVRDHTRPHLYLAGMPGLLTYRTDLHEFGATLAGGAGLALTVTPNGRYLLTFAQGLAITDLATRELVGVVQGADGLDIAVSSDGERAYVAPNLTADIAIVDILQRSVRRYIYGDGALTSAVLVADTLLIATDNSGYVVWLRAER